MNRNVVGLDIAKQVFHLFMMLDGKATKRKLKRSELLEFMTQLPPSLIALEACSGSHHWARSFQALEHEVVLLNARYVKAFVVGNKNDFNDAEAIFTAARQPNKRTVTIKNLEQQDLTMVHGIRQDKVEERTALINQIRGHLAERGLVVAEKRQSGEETVAVDFGGCRESTVDAQPRAVCRTVSSPGGDG